MSIVIPSKKIYGDMDRQIIKNNAISNVKITNKSISYTKEFDSPFLNYETSKGIGELTFNNDASKSVPAVESENVLSYYDVYSTYALTSLYLQYASFDVAISGVSYKDLKYIEKVTNIDINVFGKVTTATATRLDSASDTVFSNVKVEENQRYQYYKDKISIKNTVVHPKKSSVVSNADAEFVLPTNITYSITNDVIYISITNACVGIRQTTTQTDAYRRTKDGTLIEETIHQTGDYFEKIAKSMEVMINGDFYQIDFEDTIYTKGTSQSYPFSLEVNPFIQKGNYYMSQDISSLVERQADKILQSYANGKEIATIRASIGEYYDETGELKVSTKHELPKRVQWVSRNATPNNDAQGTNVTVISRNENGAIYLIPSLPTIVSNLAHFNNMGMAYLTKGNYEVTVKRLTGKGFGWCRINNKPTADDTSAVEIVPVITTQDPNGATYTFQIENDTYAYLHFSIIPADDADPNNPEHSIEFSIRSLDTEARMVFAIGDNVIPMIYTYEGTDAPMSRYRDGSPKAFRVCGTKIYYDGAVWQELTLQEV